MVIDTLFGMSFEGSNFLGVVPRRDILYGHDLLVTESNFGWTMTGKLALFRGRRHGNIIGVAVVVVVRLIKDSLVGIWVYKRPFAWQSKLANMLICCC